MDDISQLVDSARAYRIQETPYFKRLRMREESDLRHLREAQEIVQQSAKDFLELQLRRIRLNKLYNDIHQNIEKSSSDSKCKGQHQRIQKVFSTFDEIRRSRISMSRRRGNEYSRQNRSHLEIIPKDDTTQIKILNKKYDNVFIKRKMYGQQVSKFNLRKLQKYSRPYINTTNTNNNDNGVNNGGIVTVKRNKKDDYGTYYTLRNRLNYKDTLGEYDDEYTDLLMKCVSFEKEHLDVCGFLEEKLKSNYGDINKIISKVTNKNDNANITTATKLLNQVGITSAINITSALNTTDSSKDDDEETELDSISLHTDILSNRTGQQLQQLHTNNIENNKVTNSNETYQTITRIDTPAIASIITPILNHNNNNNHYLQEAINNSELFTSETVLHTNRYLNSVEEENDDDINYIDENSNDNNDDDNNSNIINENDIVVIEDSDAVNDESIPTIYQSQHSIHNENIQKVVQQQQYQQQYQSQLNINLGINDLNDDPDADTYRNTLTTTSATTKSSDLDDFSEQIDEEITDDKYKNNDNNNNNNNNYVDEYDDDNISEKSRQFEEELEALRYSEEDIENISRYVMKNNFVLEDVISDMIENSRIDGTPLNFYKLLSNIYLAYGMNLIKSSVDEQHIDLNVIKSAAEKQNASMSHALHVIFSSR